MAQDNKALEKDNAGNSQFTIALAAEKADHAEAEKNSASLKASQPASKSTCGQVASDHETSVKAFAEGLDVLADATQVCQDETGGAQLRTNSRAQERSASCSQKTINLSGFEVVAKLRTLAKKEHFAAFPQLALHISAVMKFGAGVGAGEGPFSKVKGLITESINRLQSEASSEANHKSHCDDVEGH